MNVESWHNQTAFAHLILSPTIRCQHLTKAATRIWRPFRPSRWASRLIRFGPGEELWAKPDRIRPSNVSRKLWHTSTGPGIQGEVARVRVSVPRSRPARPTAPAQSAQRTTTECRRPATSAPLRSASALRGGPGQPRTLARVRAACRRTAAGAPPRLASPAPPARMPGSPCFALPAHRTCRPVGLWAPKPAAEKVPDPAHVLCALPSPRLERLVIMTSERSRIS